MVKIGRQMGETRRHRLVRERQEKDLEIEKLQRLTASLTFKQRLSEQRVRSLEERIQALENNSAARMYTLPP